MKGSEKWAKHRVSADNHDGTCPKDRIPETLFWALGHADTYVSTFGFPFVGD